MHIHTVFGEGEIVRDGDFDRPSLFLGGVSSQELTVIRPTIQQGCHGTGSMPRADNIPSRRVARMSWDRFHAKS